MYEKKENKVEAKERKERRKRIRRRRKSDQFVFVLSFSNHFKTGFLRRREKLNSFLKSAEIKKKQKFQKK